MYGNIKATKDKSSDISQAQKDKFCTILHVECGKKKKKSNLEIVKLWLPDTGG